MPHVGLAWDDWAPIDPELLKRIYDDLVSEYGVTVLFNTTLSGVETDGKGRISEIIVSNKAGLTAYRARVFVDCTGDADLAAWAGAQIEIGSAGQGVMPSTHCFILTNIDEYAYRFVPRITHDNPSSPIYDILKSGEYPLIKDFHTCNSHIGPGAVGFNAGHIFAVDSTDPASVSQALMEGRKIAHEYQRALAKHYPAFANAFLAVTGSLLGVRESRRVIGDYVLTHDDYLARRTFSDEIGRNCYCIDIHRNSADDAKDYNDLHNLLQEFQPYAPGESHGIPYRCLTPQGLSNLLVAGRGISCDQYAQASIRVMPCCLVTGEAAGMAAAQAACAEDVDVHLLDTAHLRTRLRDEGAYLPEVGDVTVQQ